MEKKPESVEYIEQFLDISTYHLKTFQYTHNNLFKISERLTSFFFVEKRTQR